MVGEEEFKEEALLEQVEVFFVLFDTEVEEALLGQGDLDLRGGEQLLHQFHLQDLGVVEVRVL